MPPNLRVCVVHYSNIEAGRITELNDKTFQRLLEARSARRSLGGKNLHSDQCNKIPFELDTKYHAVHRDCYAKFTKAISILKRSGTQAQGIIPKQSKRKRCDEPESCKILKKDDRDSRGIFPKKCMAPTCLKTGPIKVGGVKQDLAPLLTVTACETLLRAAHSRRDEEMLTSIRDVDLIAKEFCMHRKCYRDYTRVTSATRRAENCTEATSESVRTDETKLFCFVERYVLSAKQSVSMKLLTDIYGLDGNDSRYRCKVKLRLESKYSDRLLFVSVAHKLPMIVISRDCLTNISITSFIDDCETFFLTRAANMLQTSLLDIIRTAGDTAWPPTPESLSSTDRLPPKLVVDFIKRILNRSDHHTAPERTDRWAMSLAEDLLFGVSGGEFMTRKHVLLATGLHGLTGQKLPILLLNRLGHSITYDTVRKIETAQAEVSQQLARQGYELPLIPSDEKSRVLTFFWWDNFDAKKENF